MPSVDVTEHDGGLRLALTEDGRVTDLYMGVERQARLGTEAIGVTGYTIESIVSDGLQDHRRQQRRRRGGVDRLRRAREHGADAGR